MNVSLELMQKHIREYIERGLHREVKIFWSLPHYRCIALA